MTTLTETSVAGNDDRRDNNRNNENNNNAAAHKLMVALDVDGTLVDHDGHMSVPVREAAQAVVAAGHHVIIATGRSLNATLPIIEHIGIDNGYAVCSNGGVTLRLDSSLADGYEIVHKATFDPGPVLRALRKRLPTAKYALEDEDGNFLSTERFQDASFGVEAIGVDFQTMLEATAVRVVVFSAENTPEEFNDGHPAHRPGRRDVLGGLDGVAGHRRRRRDQGQRAGAPPRPAGASRRTARSPSATAATTSRCSPGPPAAWPWARRPRK